MRWWKNRHESTKATFWPVQLHGHFGDGGGQALHFRWKRSQVSCQDGVVDLEQWLVIREGHVEDGEEGDKARVSFVASTTGLAHSSNIADVLHVLPVEVFATVIHTTTLQQQLQESNGLLCAIRVHLAIETLTGKCQGSCHNHIQELLTKTITVKLKKATLKHPKIIQLVFFWLGHSFQWCWCSSTVSKISIKFACD